MKGKTVAIRLVQGTLSYPENNYSEYNSKTRDAQKKREYRNLL